MPIEPTVLAFDDRRVDGWHPVTHDGGSALAWIALEGWTRTRFRAVTAGSRPLCSGRSRTYWSRWWDVYDPTGRWIAAMQTSVSGLRRTVEVPDGRVLTIHGHWIARDWVMTDASGALVMSSLPTSSTWSWWHPDSWAVQVHDRSLSLAQIVGIVSAHRQVVRLSRN